MKKFILKMFHQAINITYFISFKKEQRQHKKFQNKIDNISKTNKKHNYSVPSEPKTSIRAVANNLNVGDLTNNTNYMYIQDLGKYISPIGDTNPHTVNIYEIRNYQKVKIAEIETSNNLYSEWIVACCNSIWKTQHKIFQDMHGNSFPDSLYRNNYNI